MTRGSLQYWPRRRAKRRLPRIRSRPRHGTHLGDIIAYKAGMTSVSMIDDSESPTKQQEISRACTILDVPSMEIYGMRFYSNDDITGYKVASTELCSKDIAQKLKIKSVKNDESKLDSFKQRLGEFTDITALVVAYPKNLNVEQNHPERFETSINAKTIEEKFAFVSSHIGKEIRAGDVFKPGEYIDLVSISTGKGWQGTIKRFGTARLDHKATQKTRHIGNMGSMGLGRVLYTVPHAGQMGFNYRTERNKRILKVYEKDEASSLNKSGGFNNYGVIKGAAILLDGSVPGPAKRLVRIKESNGNINAKGIKEPKVVDINR